MLINIHADAFAEDMLAAHVSGEERIDAMIDIVRNRWSTIWHEGSTETYFPLYTYHLRFAYDDSKIASFNENPWGFGLGRGLYASDGTWHGIYAITFLDSHAKVEPIAGYGVTYAVGRIEGITVSVGYTAFLTAREDIKHYLPLPGILPVAALSAGRASLMATFIPGGHNNGNVVFIFGRIELR